MRKLLIFCFIQLFSSFTFSQDLRFFHPDQDYLFQSGGRVIGTRVDSITYKNGTASYHLPHNFIFKNSQNTGSDTVFSNGPSLFGNGILINKDSSLSIFSNFNDTLSFNPYISFGDTSLLYKADSYNIWYYLDSVSLESFLDTSAIIYSYRFKVRDSVGEELQTFPNDYKVEIADGLGLVETINWSVVGKKIDFTYPYPLDEISTYGVKLKLIGLPFLALGVEPLTPKTIYDLDPGEEVHLESYTYHNYFATGERTQNINHIERKCLSKNETPASVAYEFQYTYRFFSSLNNSGIKLDTAYKVTKSATYGKLQRYTLPGNFQHINDQFFFYNDLIENRNLNKREVYDYSFHHLDDNIYTSYIYHDLCYSTPYYLKGLGGPFVPECGNGTAYRHYKKLVYYKKGNETFGTPLVVNSNVGQKPKLSVYPNPTSKKLFISIPENEFEDLEVEVVGLDGRTVTKQQTYDMYSPIDVSSLEAGVYFISISTNNQTYKASFVKQ